MPDLFSQLEYLRDIHKQDFQNDCDGTFMFDSMEKKSKFIAKEFN